MTVLDEQPEVSAAVAGPGHRLRLVSLPEQLAAPLVQMRSLASDDLQESIARGVDEAFASFAREFRC